MGNTAGIGALRKGGNGMKKRSNFTVMAKLIRLVKPLTGYMLLAIFLGLLGHLCAASLTIFGGLALLGIAGVREVSLTAIFILLFVCAFARGFLRYGEQSCNHFIAFKLLALLRDRVFYALRRLCPAKLEGRDRGNLISVITSDIELLEVFYAHTISPAVIACLFTVILCLFIGSFHPLLGVVAFVAYLTVGVFVPLLLSKANGDAGLKFREKSGALSGFVLDSLRGLTETIQYGQGEERLRRMNERTDALAQDEAHMKKLAGRGTGATNTVILSADLIMLICAAALYQKGAVGFDGVLIPTLALMSSFGPVVALANLGSTLQNTFAAGNRVLDILEEEPQVEEIKEKEKVRFSGAEAKHVTFSYEAKTILSDVSCKIPENTITGIVGRSGSGKSTLLKLFMRFWDTKQGKIEISGVPVSDINTSDLRAMESYMTQETCLFHDSIANNLKIAKPDATAEELIAACKKASVHDFIESLPNGYDTKVGELGDTLSGGERQRIGLARVFLHDAPFILLDEPTSNLDSLNEAVILQSLAKERGKKTVVLVSHRSSTMRIADQVYSVEHGRMS